MKTVKEKLQNEFKCIADKCPCTCCSGWQIMVDEKSLKRFENYEGVLKENINNSIDWIESSILQCENGDCAFLCEDGLCELIKAEGEDILCDTCKLYPRHVEEYEDLREWSVSLSCPEAARMVANLDSFFELESAEDDEPDPLEDEFEDFDIILFDKLLEARDVFFDILKNDSLKLGEKVGLISEMSEELQRLYDTDEVFEMDDVIERFSNPDYQKANAEEFEISFSGYVREDSGVLGELETLSDDWENVLESLKNYPYSQADRMDSFIAGMDEKGRDLLFSNILGMLLYTYFPGAIYNGMIYGYAQMCIFSAIMMDALALCRRDDNNKVSLDAYVEMMYRYSRETEHSDINIGILLEHFDSKM